MSADSPVGLTPPDHRPRKRIVVAATALTCFAAGVAASLWAIDTPTRVHVETFAQPVNVAIPASPPLPPITVVVAPPPPPAPPVAQPIRATRPFLDPACVPFALNEDETQAPSSCDWSDGLPAVSLDESLVVAKVVPDDGGRGYPGLTVRFIDVKTSKTVRDIVVLDPDEVDPAYSGSSDDAGYAEVLAKHRTMLRTKIYRRVLAAQKAIDAKGYRTMVDLENRSGDPDLAAEEPTSVYAQFDLHHDKATVRAIDPATSTSLWTHTFGEPWTATPRVVDPEAECGGLSLAEMTIAWDPQTRIVLASSTWHFGGCLCGSGDRQEVVKL